MVTNVYCSIISFYWYLINYVLSFVLCGIFSIIINLLGGISFWTHHVQCIKLAKIFEKFVTIPGEVSMKVMIIAKFGSGSM